MFLCVFKCDDCGKTIGMERKEYIPEAVIRSELTQNQWTISKGKVLCPACQAKEKLKSQRNL